MPVPIKIDFVSDVSCPWCVIGLRALEEALLRLGNSVSAQLHFQPFELNPQMPLAGQDINEHLANKYGLSSAQLAANAEALRVRGAELGFEFRMAQRTRVYNTFDAHRLLHWAELEGRGLALKHALLSAYFTDGVDVSAHDRLISLADSVGLDAGRAREILSSSTYAAEVRAQQRFYAEKGIRAVPAVILNDQYLISGGQPIEVFEQALRQAAGL